MPTSSLLVRATLQRILARRSLHIAIYFHFVIF